MANDEGDKTLSLVKRANVKFALRPGFHVRSDFYEELDKRVAKMIEMACIRADLNGRSTIMYRDLV